MLHLNLVSQNFCSIAVHEQLKNYIESMYNIFLPGTISFLRLGQKNWWSLKPHLIQNKMLNAANLFYFLFSRFLKRQMRYPYFDSFFPYKIDKKCSDSNQNLNFHCFENCWYLIKVAYIYWKFHQLHVAVILNAVISKNRGIVTEKWKKSK